MSVAGPSAAFWEPHYQARTGATSGRPGAVLSDVVASLAPGRALDLGCGLGDDAIWLATRGWRVTGVDVSATAVARANARAEALGLAAEFQRHDLSRTFPAGRFDLVSAQYLESPVDFERTRVLRRAAEAVASGGLLLVVRHGSVAPWSWADPDTRFPTAEAALAELRLDPTPWETVRLGSPEREATGPQGQTARVRDIVIALRRRRGLPAPAAPREGPSVG